MIIKVGYDSSVTASNFTNFAADGFASGADEEAAFKGAVTYAITELASLFTNPVTLNITIAWGQTSAPNQPASNNPNLVSVDYSALRSALISNANHSGDPIQLAAVATLPATDPLGGNYQITSGEAKALGVPGSSDVDGTITFNSSDNWSFVPNVAPASANEVYFIGTAEHEITEEMGRVASLQQTFGSNFTTMDLFRYSAPHVRETSPVPTDGSGDRGYFSLNKGITDYPGLWNNAADHGDLGDWRIGEGPAPGGQDSLGSHMAGQVSYLTTTDVALMAALGWDPAYPENEVPNGVTAWVAGNNFPLTVAPNYFPNNQTSSGLIILSGGYLEVGSDGTALRTVIKDGGSAQVDAGGGAISTVVKAGGVEIVVGNDLDTLLDGGEQLVLAGGIATNTAVGNGADQVIFADGTASSTTVEKGGVQTDSGTASGTIVHNGGVQDVEIGGNANGTIVDKGGLQDVLGTASKTTVSGEQDIFGLASGTTVKAGGVEIVKPGGNATGTVVDNGGAQDVFGGTATDTTVKSGGMQLVGFVFTEEGSGGTAVGTVVKSGGIQDDFGTASSTTVSGEQDVFGIANGTIIKTGGQEIVESGGVANGATISGGMLEFKTGATTGSAEITFVGKGILTLDDSFDFSGLVAGFDNPNDVLDLKDIAFVTGKTSETFTQLVPDGGQLTVSDGMHTADIKLLGSYITQDFQLASDGHGGTLVTESPIAGAAHLPHGFLL